MNTAAHEPRSSPTGGLTSVRRPRLIVFDVNETLSDTSAMFDRFADVGAPGHLFDVWFAGLLRDGFALTSAGTAQPFATIGSALLRHLLSGIDLDRPVDDAMLVAVHPWDIAGARRAGMSTAWINRNAAYPSYFSEPDVEATSIAHLARVLSGS